MRKAALSACVLSAIVLAGCSSIPRGADRLNMITEQEAKANNCVLLDKAGSISLILINGSKRNTQAAVRKALTVKGATHVGYATPRAFPAQPMCVCSSGPVRTRT